ncbi:MAG: hypothetical protein ACLP07_02485 [Terracidiphilus sp.]
MTSIPAAIDPPPAWADTAGPYIKAGEMQRIGRMNVRENDIRIQLLL